MRSSIRWLGDLVIFLVAGLVVIALGYLILLGIQAVEGSINLSVANAALRITSALTGLLLLVGCASLLVLLLRALWHRRATFGATLSIRLLGLAVVSILFGNAVVELVTSPVVFGARLVERLSPTLSSEAVLSPDAPELSAARFSDLLITQLQGQIAAVFNQAASTLYTLPVKEIILALGFWAALGALFSATTDGSSGQTAGLRAWWTARSPAQQRAYTLTTLLIVGAYLSIAAIIAIPWLDDDDEDVALSKERVERQLRGTQIVEASLPSLTIDTIEIWRRLSSLKGYMDTVKVRDTTRAGISRQAEWRTRLGRVRSEIDQVEREIRGVVTAAQRRRQELLSAQQDRISRALESYDRETSYQMAPAERVIYLRELSRWLSGSVSGALQESAAIRIYLDRIETEIHEWIVARQSDIEEQAGYLSAAPSADPMDGSTMSLTQFSFSRPVPSLSSLAIQLNAPLQGEREPRPPDPGSAWGPFGWIADWLLGTRSIALAQIAGMLGFGLIGATIGVFGRRDSANRTAARPYGEVAAVVVQGLAATLVVFLAVKGGLAILSQNGSEPNSYVLFFLCLLGAIYSDDVWTWAQSRLRQALPPDAQGGSSAAVSRKPTTPVVPGEGKSTAASRSGKGTTAREQDPAELDEGPLNESSDEDR
jgi:hypothetical protein